MQVGQRTDRSVSDQLRLIPTFVAGLVFKSATNQFVHVARITVVPVSRRLLTAVGSWRWDGRWTTVGCLRRYLRLDVMDHKQQRL